MKSLWRYCLKNMMVFFLIYVIPGDIQCQITSVATFQLDSVRIGDPIKVEIKVMVPSGTKVNDLDFSGYRNIENLIYQQDTVLLEKVADIEILDYGKWKHSDIANPIPAASLNIVSENGQQLIQNTITIAIYNEGVFAIPGPTLNAASPLETLPTAVKKIQVLLPQSMTQKDSLSLNPIKDIMSEASDITDYLVYIYILGALLLMIGVGYYFYKRKKKMIEVIPEPVVIILPAHEKALKALNTLNEAQLWQKGLIKEYQTSLTDIIRNYLEDRYGIRAKEMTTDEINGSLQQVSFDLRHMSTLVEILQVADLVKFAKATPDDNIHAVFMDKAIKFVEQTQNSNAERNPEI